MPTTPAHDVIRIGQIEVQFRLDASQTGGAFTMFEFRVPPGARVPVPHSHVAFDETVFGLGGVATFTVAGETGTVGPGDVLFIPRGAVHGFENCGTDLAHGLSVITPGLLGPAFFQEVGAIVNAGGPPDVARIAQVMQRHGLRPVAPA